MIERKVRMFTLGQGNYTGTEMTEIIIRSLSNIKRFVEKTPPPYIVTVTKSGRLSRVI